MFYASLVLNAVAFAALFYVIRRLGKIEAERDAAVGKLGDMRDDANISAQPPLSFRDTLDRLSKPR